MKLDPKLEEETKNLVHKGFTCDCCEENPIKGIRYHSKKLKNFNLCKSCYKTREEELGMGKHPFESITQLIQPPKKKKPIKVQPVVVVNTNNVYKPVQPVYVQPVVNHQPNHGIQCKKCHSNIYGNRYKCIGRINYDLCQNCFDCESNKGYYRWGLYKFPNQLSRIIEKTTRIGRMKGSIRPPPKKSNHNGCVLR